MVGTHLHNLSLLDRKGEGKKRGIGEKGEVESDRSTGGGGMRKGGKKREICGVRRSGRW